VFWVCVVYAEIDSGDEQGDEDDFEHGCDDYVHLEVCAFLVGY